MNKVITLHLLAVFLLLLGIQEAQCRKNTLSIPPPSEQIMYGYITHQILATKASSALNTTYLGNLKGKILNQYKGIIFGSVGKRAIASIPVRLARKSCPIQINVIFKVDTGTPFSSLTTEALNKLFENCPTFEQTFNDNYPVAIAGYKMRVQESKAHFQNLNVLGADFLEGKDCRLELDYLQYKGGQFKLILQGSKLAKNKKQKKKIQKKKK